jgi:uncharacterized protein
VKLFVEAWDPTYGAAVESPDFAGGGAPSEARLELDVERPAEAWEPISPPPDVRAPDVALLVDGVRRTDARVWVGDETTVLPGLAASYAAGVVRCDLRRASAEVVTARVQRGVFTPFTGGAPALVTSAGRYPVLPAKSGDLMAMSSAVQQHLQALESSVLAESRDESTADELLVADGPLRGRAGISRMLGYIKSHEKRYLNGLQSSVVMSLKAGQRSPVFKLGTRWEQYTWYLRLPGPGGAPWSNLARIECSVELPAQAAIALADLSMVTLPRFAATSYKDPRAPQNLVPIAGLERRLRTMLGDGRLLHRALTLAAHREPAGV